MDKKSKWERFKLWLQAFMLLRIHNRMTADRLAELQQELRYLKCQYNEMEKVFKQHTVMSADIHLDRMNCSHVVVTGRYRNNDYVRIFSLDHENLPHLIDQLKSMEKFAGLDRVDAPLNIRSFISGELKSKGTPL